MCRRTVPRHPLAHQRFWTSPCVQRAIINCRKSGVATRLGKGSTNRKAPTALEADITRPGAGDTLHTPQHCTVNSCHAAVCRSIAMLYLYLSPPHAIVVTTYVYQICTITTYVYQICIK